MARSVSNMRELGGYMEDIVHETEEALLEGSENGLRALALEIAEDAPHNPEKNDYEGLPWNLAPSIGVDERIPRAKAKIPGLADRRDFEVQLDGGDPTGAIGYGMLYAKATLRRDEWDRPALSRADRTIVREQDLALAKVERRVA